MKYFTNWSWFSKIIVMDAIVAVIGLSIFFSGYFLIGTIMVWTAFAINIVALIVRWKTRNEII